MARLGVARANALQVKTSQRPESDAARVRALGAYQDFLSRWRDADPDIPILKQAKAEYAKLQQDVQLPQAHSLTGSASPKLCLLFLATALFLRKLWTPKLRLRTARFAGSVLLARLLPHRAPWCYRL